MTNDIVEKVERATFARDIIAKHDDAITLGALQSVIERLTPNQWQGECSHLCYQEIKAVSEAILPFITAARIKGVKMGLGAAAKAADESIDALSDDCCLDHVGDAVAAIRNLDAEAIVRNDK